MISLDPISLDEVLDDLVELAAAAGEPARGERLRDALRGRIEAVRVAVAGAPRPRVAALEWLDPLFAGGHWVPQMVELAGGSDVLGRPRLKSRVVSWEELEAASPEVVVSMPCGLYADEAAAQTREYGDRMRGLRARIVAVDAASSFSRPGPRLADGVELLAHLLHPERVPQPPAIAFETI